MTKTKWIAAGLLAFALFSCNKKNQDGPDPILNKNSHYDIWISIGENSGMGKDGAQLVANVNTLLEGEDIDFVGQGADVTTKMHMESAIKGDTYYQVNPEKRLGKYKIQNGTVVVVKEVPYTRFDPRKYCFAWIDGGKSLLLMGAAGDKKKVLWSKIDPETLTELSHGEIKGLPLPEGKEEYTTSGLLAFRQQDGMLIYTFAFNKMSKSKKPHFYAAFINPKDMSLKKVVKEDRAHKMAGTAYGELLQSKSFFDEKGNFYLPAVIVLPHPKSSTIQHSKLLRINAGTMEFDKNYNGFEEPTGKIVTAEYAGNGKALLYIQDPARLGLGDEMDSSIWGSKYNCYYGILDLASKKLKQLDLPANSGTFSQRSFCKDGKAFIGINPKDSQPMIYYYDLKAEKLIPGLKIRKGYLFDRIVPIHI